MTANMMRRNCATNKREGGTWQRTRSDWLRPDVYRMHLGLFRWFALFLSRRESLEKCDIQARRIQISDRATTRLPRVAPDIHSAVSREVGARLHDDGDRRWSIMWPTSFVLCSVCVQSGFSLLCLVAGTSSQWLHCRIASFSFEFKANWNGRQLFLHCASL